MCLVHIDCYTLASSVRVSWFLTEVCLTQVEGQLFELEQLQHQLPLLEQATAKLEDLVGSSSSQLDFFQPSSLKAAHSDLGVPTTELLSVRLEAAVESASLVAAELQSIHRQHVTTGLLLQQEELKAKQLEADLAKTKVRLRRPTLL